MALKHLISKVSIPEKNIHRIQGELPDTHEAADIYDDDIRNFFLKHQQASHVFDFILLGIGDDGHTASLFPGVSYPLESSKWVASFWIEKLNSFRISLLPQLINQGAFILVLIVGIEKSKIIKKIVEGSVENQDYPILGIYPQQGKILWLMDKPACSLLRS